MKSKNMNALLSLSFAVLVLVLVLMGGRKRIRLGGVTQEVSSKKNVPLPWL